MTSRGRLRYDENAVESMGLPPDGSFLWCLNNKQTQNLESTQEVIHKVINTLWIIFIFCGII